MIKYIVVHASTFYAILLERPSLNLLGVVVFRPHFAMKFPLIVGSIITLQTNQKVDREFYKESLQLTPMAKGGSYIKNTKMIAGSSEETNNPNFDPRMNNNYQVKLVEETSTFQLSNKEGKVTRLDNQLLEDEKSYLQQIVQSDVDIFAGSMTDMQGNDPEFHCHKLSICRDAKPLAQRKRKMWKKGVKQYNKKSLNCCQLD